MPVTIQSGLPAENTLQQENIFYMNKERAASQDIRPLQVAILNLMPQKSVTETQLIRLLGNTPLQVEITFLRTATYQPKNTEVSYLRTFYQTFEDVCDKKFDALIVTGSPVEKLAFEDVQYWEELTTILDWAEEHVYSSLFVCWGAQAALYHYYKVEKRPLAKKLSGVFTHGVTTPTETLVRGFDDCFLAPHSRHTTVEEEEIRSVEELKILAVSAEAGVYLAASKDDRQVFITGHCEYDALTLDSEYRRDLLAGLEPEKPVNYYPGDDEGKVPSVSWRSHANLLFSNWLNYCVYQRTPYALEDLPLQSSKRPLVIPS
ncbi:homoserine O-succinyltransferase [Sphaerochaeta sp. PS]|uniref:homoserine O-acetyltransferase MetA n=1 Tax=Sphaerochaeta sp. PS TaxID=3076336 RepID=UPI0028A4BAD6|nr:homoserine O-succinyltransferase [Sphaerochaeta sp. PS]MDT4762802.1 homoserine O-succinyltransferase [Sphaerochaeta sp. PS]